MNNNYPRLRDNPQVRRRMTEIAGDFRKEPTKLRLSVLRIKAELVEKDLSSALEMIRARIRELQVKPGETASPVFGEGRGGS